MTPREKLIHHYRVARASGIPKPQAKNYARAHIREAINVNHLRANNLLVK